MKLLLDTNFIVAYILPNDTLHERAIELEEELDLLSMECFVTNNVITEVINILGHIDSVNMAVNTYNMMKDSFTCLNEYEIPNFNEIIFKRYKRINKYKENPNSKHKLGFADCSLIEACRYYGLDGVVTFDSKFATADMVKVIS